MARVVVAMSGGVDSSVAAALLAEQGHEVIGVMLRLWSEPAPPRLDGASQSANRCCTPEAVEDARLVAARLGIPFFVSDAAALFKAEVVDPWMAAYAAGATPNPCLWCNRSIRFGHLLRTARGLGAGFIATGHYAQARFDPQLGEWQLWRGADLTKDQSYVLSVLGQADLAEALFPMGGFTKQAVREMAAERGLPTASRPDSQDLCFVADGDYRRFLSAYAAGAIRPGPIVEAGGRVLGEHRGLPFYTIGQRSGLGIAAAQPLYVIAMDAETNVLRVGPAPEAEQRTLRAGPARWVAGQPPADRFAALVQLRYRAHPAPAAVTLTDDGGFEAHFDSPQRGIAPGQAAVLYDGDRVLGQGTIS